MPLQVALTYHFSQPIDEQVQTFDRICYRGLLNVLRSHNDLKFNLSFSGTLLRGLAWFSPETLALVKEGLVDGQFALLGTPYADTVLFAGEEADNRLQLILGRRVLAEMLDAAPTVFWAPDRGLRPALLPQLASVGYSSFLLEDAAFEAAGHVVPTPVRVTEAGATLTAFWDDRGLRERLNWAAWYGQMDPLWAWLDARKSESGKADPIMVYAEDAGAMGRWGWEAGYLPQSHWAGLDRVLSEFEARGVSTVHLEGVKARQGLALAGDYTSGGADRVAQSPEARGHEPGYPDYPAFLAQAPKLNYFKRLFGVVRANFADTSSTLAGTEAPTRATPNSAGERFLALAEEVYAAHQYGFGRMGVGGREYWGWENVRNTFLYLRLAQLAADPTPRRWIEDLNGDGNDEQLWCDGRQLVMLSGYGGRLVGWFDLIDGIVWVSNSLAIPQARYVEGASAHPKLNETAAQWLPQDGNWDLRVFKALRQKESPPLRLAAEVAAELAAQAGACWTYACPTEPVEQHPRLNIQHGALNDWWSLDGGNESQAAAYIDYRFEDSGILYLNAAVPDLVIHKEIQLIPNGLAALYRVQNRTGRRRVLRWRLSNELAPDYAAVLGKGRDALEPLDAPEGIFGAVNRHGDAAVAITASRAWDSTAWSRGLFALQVEGTLQLDLPARGALAWQVEFKAR
ncbi:MAG TPA: hypothetical protein PLC98_12625 [Anaerolineales bacterium]|nr:hypothetical protein [Anaerolineales bacterium]